MMPEAPLATPSIAPTMATKPFGLEIVTAPPGINTGIISNRNNAIPMLNQMARRARPTVVSGSLRCFFMLIKMVRTNAVGIVTIHAMWEPHDAHAIAT